MLDSGSMERRIRDYFDSCNEADFDKIRSHFVDDAVHYFPPGMYRGPFIGSSEIAERWVIAVQSIGSIWTVDQIITDPTSGRAVIEWSHFKTIQGTLLRGDEWYIFEQETGLIKEIRAYYAAPQDAAIVVNELGGYDYQGRGYPMEPPFDREGTNWERRENE